jgi:hypothetical protein
VFIFGILANSSDSKTKNHPFFLFINIVKKSIAMDDIMGGARRKNPKKSRKQGSRKQSNRAHVGRQKQKSRVRHSRKSPQVSKYRHSKGGLPQALPSRATKDMPLSYLQMMAKRKGIPFGGLNKTKLVNKINTY